MRAIELQDDFGLENLRLVEPPAPSLGPGEIRLKMKAMSLNYRDLLMVQGHYNPRQPLPLIPLSDGVGEVVELGPGVSRFAIGDRVCPIFAQDWIAGEPGPSTLRTTLGGPLDGTLRDEMVVPEHGAVLAPAHLTDAEAACLPCAPVTAWSALFTQGNLQPGDTLLVQGTGGVSTAALQLGAAAGARVIVTSSSDEKLERAKALGATDTINYRQFPAWSKEVRRLTDGRGVDHVVEVGGAGTLPESLKSVRMGGHISMIGVLSSAAQNLNVLPILMRNIRVQGVLVGNRESFEAMNRALIHHQLRPPISHRFSFDQAAEALQLLSEGKHFGKIVLEL